jgi:hypothetical protein
MGELKPIFLVGAGRSGTTMLRLILNGHSQIRIPSEAWFIGDMLQHLPLSGSLTKSHLKQACDLILSHDRWKDWNCPDDVLRKTVLEAGQVTLSELIDLLFRSCSRMGTKTIWGEKSPKHSYCVQKLHQVFPGARFIHLVRDGRDVCATMIKRGWYEGSLRRCAMAWSGTVGAAFAAHAFGPERYLQVRFEDIVIRTEDVVRDICRFLDVAYEPQMLDYTAKVDQEIQVWERGIHEKLYRAPDAREIGKAKGLGPWRLLLIESIAGKNLRKAGYQLLCPWWLFWARFPCAVGCVFWQKIRELLVKVRSVGPPRFTRAALYLFP